MYVRRISIIQILYVGPVGVVFVLPAAAIIRNNNGAD